MKLIATVPPSPIVDHLSLQTANPKTKTPYYMKLNLDRKTLLAALVTVKAPALGRMTLPILSHVALSTHDQSVELVCTNLDLTLRTQCEADVRLQGQICVSAAKLHAIVAAFTGDDVDLELTEKGQLLVQSGSSKYHLNTLPIGDFPPVAHKFADADEVTLPQARFRQMLAVTSFCSSEDEARYVLQGNLLTLNGEITTVATDGRRLAHISETTDEDFKKPREVIIPAATITELLRLLATDGESKDRVRVKFGEAACQFTLGETVLTTKLIEGNYPNYRQVMPDTRGIKPVTLSRAELLTLLQRVSIINPDSCRLEFNRMSLTVRSAFGKDVVGDAYENMDITECKKPMKMCFNPKYLIEALKAITDDEILFFASDALAPGLFKTSPKSVNVGWNYVVMPMRGDEAAPAAEPAPAAAEAGAAAETPAAKPEKPVKAKAAAAAPAAA